MSVNKYVLYCVTEQQFVTVWSQNRPTHCPNSIDHIIEENTISIVETVSPTSTNIQNQTSDILNTTLVNQKTNLIDIKAMFGYSALRDNIIITGAAILTNNPGDGEYNLETTIGSNDSVSLISIETGKYLSGASAELGMAIRIPQALIGNQQCKWGYYDDNNGFYFKKTGTDFYVCILRGGVETSFNSSQFNIDKLDGKGTSGVNLNFAIGNIFRINFSWYGYGFVKFLVQGQNSYGIQTFIPIHVFQTLGQISIKNPCLPISCELKNNNETSITSNTHLYITGREYSIIQQYIGKFREQGILITPYPVCLITLTPIMSLKIKTDYKNCHCILKSIFIKPSLDTYIEVRTFASVIGGSFIDIPNAESVMKYDKSASFANGGIKIWSGIAGQSNNSYINIESEIAIKEITVFGMSLDSTNSSTLNYFHLNWKESW